MEHLELVTGLFGGFAGGLTIAGFLAKRWLDHRLRKSLEVYKFLLTNRANACSAILLSVGRIITASRKLTRASSSDIGIARESLLQSTLELEDCLRPAHFLLDEVIYKQIHEFKTAAQTLYEAVPMDGSAPEAAEEPRGIDSRVAVLEAHRTSITSGLRGLMANIA